MATKLLNGRTEKKERLNNLSAKKNSAKEEPKPKAPFIEHQDLPSNYGTTSVTLIARDPNWIFAYWEIASHSIEAVKKIIGDEINRASCVLRMYDITAVDFNGFNANQWFDLEVGRSSNWYINLWIDNVSYCADLGLRLPDGRFFALARSNSVTTPRKAQSWRTEQIWMDVKDTPQQQQQQAPFVIGNIHRAEENRRQVRRNNPPDKAHKARKIYLSEEDIRQYYSRLSPLLRDIISRRIAAKGAHVRKAGNPNSRKRAVSLEEFRISGLAWGQFVKKLLGGASEELVIQGASESLPVGGSEQSAREKKQRKFFFEIGTELIVYGRTEPDAEVWLGNKRVPLRSDGTFTLRFALPDGKIPLDFTANSADKEEKRKITTAVERSKTRYNP